MASIVINKLPSDSDTHTWTDYVELLALVNMDNVCTADSAADRIGDISRDDDEADGIDAGEYDEMREPIANDRKRSSARCHARIRDAFALAQWRASAYAEAYPFLVDAERRSLTLAENLSPMQSLYVFLLLAANLRFFTGRYSDLTDRFEEVAECVMRDVLPARTEVHVFGKATAKKYKGSAFDKIKELSLDIRATLCVSEADFRKGDSGDSGIDIVAWHGFADSQKNILIYFGQCACSRDGWTKKQLEASPQALSNVLVSSPQWTTMMFVPVCFRRVGGGWAVLSEVASVVFIDRYRFLKNCLNIEPVIEKIREIVDVVCSNKEAIV